MGGLDMVLDRIERGEIDVLVGIKRQIGTHYYATPDNNEPLIRYGDEEGQKAKTELLRLAKLGAAAEKVVKAAEDASAEMWSAIGYPDQTGRPLYRVVFQPDECAEDLEKAAIALDAALAALLREVKP
jgi:hypothetical protein